VFPQRLLVPVVAFKAAGAFEAAGALGAAALKAAVARYCFLYVFYNTEPQRS
jgi:hypothetical protein